VSEVKVDALLASKPSQTPLPPSLVSLPTLPHRERKAKEKWNPKNHCHWTGLGNQQTPEAKMAAAALPLLLLALAAAALLPARATDPSVFLDWDISYITASPLGVPQKVTACLLAPPLYTSLPFIPTNRLRRRASSRRGSEKRISLLRAKISSFSCLRSAKI
jgi:hypothetical protein